MILAQLINGTIRKSLDLNLMVLPTNIKSCAACDQAALISSHEIPLELGLCANLKLLMRGYLKSRSSVCVLVANCFVLFDIQQIDG